MKKLSHSDISKKRLTLDQLSTTRRFPIYLILDNIRSLYNVGSIFRSSDGARVSKLFLCGYTPYPPRREIEKTALGATTSVPWEYHKDIVNVISSLRAQGIRICLLEHTDRSVPYYTLMKKDFPLCIVVGNEITGVRKEIIEIADLAVEIPMFGMKQSLNAAVACGIALFEFVKVLGDP